MPIWFLYSSVLIVIRCADLIPVFFDTYRNILYQSDISGQDAQSASIPPHVFSCRLEASARRRWHRSGQGLRRGILLGLRETAKSIAAGPELASGSDSRPCRNNAVSRSPSSNHPSSAAARPDATFLWRPSTISTSQNLKNIHDCIHSRSDAFFPWRPSTTSTS